ncbi:MAG: hypothetical protein HYR49_04565 [Gammaproteobacteria bacterium]|nr:hypothetical protein [Gammaproteobacteria bacterium]
MYRVRKVNYCYLMVASRAGQAAKVLAALKSGGVDLLAFSGFPAKGGKSQVDLVTDDMAQVRRVAAKQGWRLSKTKQGFLVQGDDEMGAALKVVQKLADAKISMTAADAVSAGRGRYGMIFWVKRGDVGRAARALNAA